MRVVSRVAIPVLLLLLAAPAAAKDTTAEEAKLRGQAAAEIVKAAAAATAAAAKAESLRMLAEAERLAADAPGLAEAKEKADALADDADAAAAEKAADKAVAAARPAVAKIYDRLAALDHDPKDESRFLDYAVAGFAWEPKPRAAKLRSRGEKDLEGPAPWDGARLLVKLRRADPDGVKKGAYDAKELDLAKSGKLLLAADNGFVAWVSFPKDWTKSKKVPVAVGVEGAGCSFLGYFGGFTSSRGSRTVIAVTPVSVTNTNADNLNPKTYPMYDPAALETWKSDLQKRIDFEGPGMEQILADLTQRFGADDRAFHTGFSGGGIYTYWRLFQHPDKVRGAAPACANFGGLGLQGAPGAKDGGPPVYLMTGEKDPHRDFTFGNEDSPGIEPQTNLAEENLKKLGYANVKRTMLPGVGHSSLHAEFWKFVDEVLAGKFGK